MCRAPSCLHSHHFCSFWIRHCCLLTVSCTVSCTGVQWLSFVYTPWDYRLKSLQVIPRGRIGSGVRVSASFQIFSLRMLLQSVEVGFGGGVSLRGNLCENFSRMLYYAILCTNHAVRTLKLKGAFCPTEGLCPTFRNLAHFNCLLFNLDHSR